MSLLLETVKLKDGVLQNTRFHNERMKKSLAILFGIKRDINLEDIIVVTSNVNSGIYKCRIEYDTEIRKIEFQPYSIKTVRSLKLVECNDIEYSMKFIDRKIFEELNAYRGPCDDILIIRNGMVTDTSYSNIIFRDLSGKWVTPSTFLLRGTRRASLLEMGIIAEADISLTDFDKYREAKLINAMIGIEDTEGFPVENIV